MKKLFALLILAATALMADSFLFSQDGVKQGSGLRELPSQGVNLKTGAVVVGLHALTDEQRMECGWYRWENNPRPDTNHYWRCTNYIFTATGTARSVWTQYTPRPRALKYSKLSILEKLAEMGKWADVKALLESEGYIDYWNACTYIAADNPRFLSMKPAIAAALGISEKQLDEILAGCLY